MPRPLEWLILLGILVLAFWVSGVLGAEVRFSQGEPPPVAAWRLYRYPRTPLATVRPAQLRPLTGTPGYYTPAPGQTPPATIRGWSVDVPAVPGGTLIHMFAVGVDGQESGEGSNLKLTDTESPTPRVTVTPTRTASPSATPPRPWRPFIY